MLYHVIMASGMQSHVSLKEQPGWDTSPLSKNRGLNNVQVYAFRHSDSQYSGRAYAFSGHHRDLFFEINELIAKNFFF